jgi:uncharacterized protein with HEPN domain
MCETLRTVARYVDGRDRQELVTDSMLEDAVVRRLTVLGEAAARVDAVFRAAHPEIPWRSIVGLRNVVTHQYDRLNLDEVWTVATEDAPRLLLQLERLLEEVQGLSEHTDASS